MNENAINKYLNGRFFTVVIFCFTVISALVSLYSNKIPQFDGNFGICLPSSNLWIGNDLLSWGVNILLISGIAVILIIINKIFPFIRSVTAVFASIFLLLESCNPYVTTQLLDGTIMCLITVAGIFILYSTYQAPQLKRLIFLIFFLLSVCSMFQYAFLFLIPIFIIGLIQMRALTLKGLIAAILGLLTPYWIAIGTGIISLDMLAVPEISSIFTANELGNVPELLINASITAFISLVLLIINLLNVFNSKLQTRAYNGFISILSLFSIIMIFIDYNNILTYIPLLNCCAAIQIAHFFTNSKYLRKYIIIAVVIIVYLTLYIWRIFL